MSHESYKKIKWLIFHNSNISGGKWGEEAEENGEGSPQHEEQDTIPEGETGPHETRENGLQDVAEEPTGGIEVSNFGWDNIDAK